MDNFSENKLVVVNKLVNMGEFQKAKILFDSLTRYAPETGKDALFRLFEIAKIEKNFENQLHYLSLIGGDYPTEKLAAVILLNIKVMKLQVSLDEHRKAISAIINLLDLDGFSNLGLGPHLLKAIHYSFSSSEKTVYLKKLLELSKSKASVMGQETLGFKLLQAEILLSLQDYVGFSHLMEAYPNQPMPNNKLKSLLKIYDKIRSPAFPNRTAQKIFGIGLSRTGTTSLNKALNMLSYHSVHWNNPHIKKLISGDDYFLFDGFTDITTSFQFEKLYRLFPDSKFVFTSREKKSWVKSVRKHYKIRRGIDHPWELKRPNIESRFGGLGGRVEENLYSRFSTWEDAYDNYSNRVKVFFESKPKYKFLDLSICGGEEWFKLCHFLEKPVPSLSFPNTNKGPES